MSSAPAPIPAPAADAPEGRAILDALAQAGIEFIVSVPDIVTSDGLLWPLQGSERFRLVRVCKEDEGVSICAALAACGRRGVLLMQQTGLMDSLNALRAMAKDYHQPVCMIVGLQGMEPDRAIADSASFGVRIVPRILDVMEIPHHTIATPEDCEAIAPALGQAFAADAPLCLLLPRSPR